MEKKINYDLVAKAANKAPVTKKEIDDKRQEYIKKLARIINHKMQFYECKR